MFTFKTEKPTGRYRSFYRDLHHIKLKGKVVGHIDDEQPFKIRLAVVKDDINEDGNPNCRWKWVTLRKNSKSLAEAKGFLQANFARITSMYRLHSFDS